MKKSNLYLTIAFGVVLLMMQLPFLLSDPDAMISISRDANTDEGQYSYQIRNYINHGDLSLYSSDCLIKTPLFGLILWPALTLFGTDYLIARLTVLLLSTALCLIIFSYNSYFRKIGSIAFIVVFSEYYIFHYFHYAMADILSTIFIFFTIFLLIKPYRKQSPFFSGFLTATFISVAYYIKIQFLYSILLIPAILLLFILFSLDERKLLFRQLFCTTLFIIGYFLVYIIFWYWPNHEFFDRVLNDQTSNRFTNPSAFINQLNNNVRFVFLNSYLKVITFIFCGLYILGFGWCFLKSSVMFRLLFISLSCWIALELHKLPMTYLPSRYLISLFFAMGMISAIVLSELLYSNLRGRLISLIKGVSFIILFVLGIKNFIDYKSAYQNRTYSIYETDNYLANFNFHKKPVIGAWAPSLCWKSRAFTFPIWKNYFNDSAVVSAFKPAVIIAEIDEEDSNQAFSSRGIEVDAYADSIKYINVNYWKLKLLWINPGENGSSPAK